MLTTRVVFLLREVGDGWESAARRLDLRLAVRIGSGVVCARREDVEVVIEARFITVLDDAGLIDWGWAHLGRAVLMTRGGGSEITNFKR